MQSDHALDMASTAQTLRKWLRYFFRWLYIWYVAYI